MEARTLGVYICQILEMKVQVVMITQEEQHLI